MTSSLRGRTAVVTGGATGIGRGIAERLLGAGANVVIVGRRAESLAAAAEALDPSGARVLARAADISGRDGCHAVARDTVERFGTIDILCLNAGIYPAARLGEITEDHLREVAATNLFGTVYLLQACEAELIRGGRGRVVVTSSITGPVTGYPGWSVYGASKAAQLGFVRSVALELAPYGVTVNAVLPGKIEIEATSEQDPDYVARATRAIPVGRLGTPRDVAAAVAFLASEDAGFITGQSLVVDGGQVLPETPYL